MKFLVDAQVFIWMFLEPGRFSSKAKSFLQDVDSNIFFLSDVSAWEASIKYGLGKMKLPVEPEYFFLETVRQAEYRHLRIDLRHVTKVHYLEHIHRDPFDRLLIAQAKLENMTIISTDRIFKQYGVEVLTLKDIS